MSYKVDPFTGELDFDSPEYEYLNRVLRSDSQEGFELPSEAAVAACEAQGGTLANTKLLIHSNTTDGSTTFTDSSDSAHTITANGDVQHDTAQAKFGTSSILFDGTGDYLSIADSTDWTLGSGDFTMDCWVRTSGVAFAGLVAQWPSGANGAFGLQMNADGTVTMRLRSGSNYDANSTATINDGAWHHVAGVRSGNTLMIFVDGADKQTADVTGVTVNDSTGEVWIGSREIGPNPLDGWMDEVRVVKGEAKWTANFTPPTLPYCDDS